jgi:hypothetical protein
MGKRCSSCLSRNRDHAIAPSREANRIPLWVQLDIDIDGRRLDQIVQAAGKR